MRSRYFCLIFPRLDSPSGYGLGQMEEIRSKYVLTPFTERTGKQKKLKFEEIDLELYKSSARCAAFKTSQDNILHWIKAIQHQYFDALKDSSTLTVKWIDCLNKDETQFDSIELKVFHSRHDNKHEAAAKEVSEVDSSNAQLLFTLHIYLTTGVIMCQGIAYESWAVAEFPHLKEKVVSSLEGRAEEQEVSAVEAEAISTRLREMFTAIHTKKGSKSLASEGVVKPIGLPSESESPKTNLVQEIPETPKASHDRKRRNSLDSTRGLSPRNSKSLSELRSSMCNLEAELIEMRNNLVIYIQRTLTRPQSSLFLLLILTRDARPRGARGVMGRRKDFGRASLVPLSPTRVSRSRSAIPHARLPRLAKRDDWGRVSNEPPLTRNISVYWKTNLSNRITIIK